MKITYRTVIEQNSASYLARSLCLETISFNPFPIAFLNPPRLFSRRSCAQVSSWLAEVSPSSISGSESGR